MKNEKGQATVELALVILVLVVFFVLPVVDFGRYLYTCTVVNDMSQKAARIVALDTTYNYTADNVEALIKPTINVQVEMIPNTTPRKSGQYVTVKVTYSEFKPVTSFIKAPEINYTSTIRVE